MNEALERLFKAWDQWRTGKGEAPVPDAGKEWIRREVDEHGVERLAHFIRDTEFLVAP